MRGAQPLSTLNLNSTVPSGTTCRNYAAANGLRDHETLCGLVGSPAVNNFLKNSVEPRFFPNGLPPNTAYTVRGVIAMDETDAQPSHILHVGEDGAVTSSFHHDANVQQWPGAHPIPDSNDPRPLLREVSALHQQCQSLEAELALAAAAAAQPAAAGAGAPPGAGRPRRGCIAWSCLRASCTAAGRCGAMRRSSSSRRHCLRR